jgi:hypothetical protein
MRELDHRRRWQSLVHRLSPSGGGANYHLRSCRGGHSAMSLACPSVSVRAPEFETDTREYIISMGAPKNYHISYSFSCGASGHLVGVTVPAAVRCDLERDRRLTEVETISCRRWASEESLCDERRKRYFTGFGSISVDFTPLVELDSRFLHATSRNRISRTLAP